MCCLGVADMQGRGREEVELLPGEQNAGNVIDGEAKSYEQIIK